MNRLQTRSEVISLEEVEHGIFVLTLRSPGIARHTQPGQFVNVRAQDVLWGPYLRRPFSVSYIDGENIELLFNVIGSGTRLLSSRRPGDMLDLVGPLGKPFQIDNSFDTAIMLAGGVGMAPFPLLQAKLQQAGKKSIALVGARTADQVCERRLTDVNVATDDGSKGFRGTVVDLFNATVARTGAAKPKVFACGPNRMLKAVIAAAESAGMPCEVSLEGDMACGIGICQGCPVERTSGQRKYALVCTEGPTFDAHEVVL